MKHCLLMSALAGLLFFSSPLFAQVSSPLFAQISMNIESSVDLTKFQPDHSQPAPKPQKPRAYPVVAKFIYSNFSKSFPLQLDSREKLEAAADKFVKELTTETRYQSTCGDIDKSEAFRPKLCDVPARLCRIQMGSEFCHFVPSGARCPDGSYAPFSPLYENRGFKVCKKEMSPQNNKHERPGTGHNRGFR